MRNFNFAFLFALPKCAPTAVNTRRYCQIIIIIITATASALFINCTVRQTGKRSSDMLVVLDGIIAVGHSYSTSTRTLDAVRAQDITNLSTRGSAKRRGAPRRRRRRRVECRAEEALFSLPTRARRSRWRALNYSRAWSPRRHVDLRVGRIEAVYTGRQADRQTGERAASHT